MCTFSRGKQPVIMQLVRQQQCLHSETHALYTHCFFMFLSYCVFLLSLSQAQIWTAHPLTSCQETKKLYYYTSNLYNNNKFLWKPSVFVDLWISILGFAGCTSQPSSNKRSDLSDRRLRTMLWKSWKMLSGMIVVRISCGHDMPWWHVNILVHWN